MGLLIIFCTGLKENLKKELLLEVGIILLEILLLRDIYHLRSELKSVFTKN